MIKENQRLLNQLHVVSDGVIVFCSMLLAYFLRYILLHGARSFSLRAYLWLALAAALLCLLTYAFFGLYASYRMIRFHKEAQRLFLATLLDTLLLLAAFFLLRLDDVSRWMLAFFGILCYLLLLAKRAAMRTILRYYRAKGYNLKHVVLVGNGEMAGKYVETVRGAPSLGFLVDGYVADGGGVDGVERLGAYAELKEILEERNPDEVVLTMPAEDFMRTADVIRICEDTGTKLSMLPFYAPYMPSNPQIDDLEGLPLFNMRRVPLDNLGNAFIKRAADIVGSLLLIVLTSPLMLFALIGVKLSSPGPILFRQERVGRNKKTFYMYKFRSMRVNSEEATGWSTDRDPRKTKFGSFIRKFSIDELPQFFNVLKGDMSLIGPRPEVPHYVELFKNEIPRYMVKHQVRPGITGWAQVNGYRGDTSIAKRIEYDIYYIENWSAFFDLRILFMTLGKLVNSEKVGKQEPAEAAK